VSSLPRIGRHSKKIIEEILDLGYSKEVEDCTSSEWFHCMQLFTSVYGCGCATARRWYQQGLHTLDDVTTCDDLTLTDTQTLGLKYYQDISVQIPRTETASITDIIRREAEACFPGTSVEAVGGYRRGKPFSHDVDLLLTHHDTAVTDCLLHTLLARLQTLGMVVHTDVSTGRNTAKNTSHDHANTSGHTFTPDGRHRLK
jgi:DNA polymerase/3'-5' exonuclease PolX